jgi:hypothetical protein
MQLLPKNIGGGEFGICLHVTRIDIHRFIRLTCYLQHILRLASAEPSFHRANPRLAAIRFLMNLWSCSRTFVETAVWKNLKTIALI